MLQNNVAAGVSPLHIWQINTTLMHWHGKAALPRRHLADRQVSPTELAFVPMLIETAISLQKIRVHPRLNLSFT
jgi:hypothetical protein